MSPKNRQSKSSIESEVLITTQLWNTYLDWEILSEMERVKRITFVWLNMSEYEKYMLMDANLKIQYLKTHSNFNPN